MRFAPLLLLVGCFEYDLGPDVPVVAGTEPEADADPGQWWEDPWSEPPDGYSNPFTEDGGVAEDDELGDGTDDEASSDDAEGTGGAGGFGDDADGSQGGAARMTGGGVADGASHGFTVHCAGTHSSNHLQVNWDGGSFHLLGVDWVVCLDDPDLDTEQPRVAFDTVVGRGWGERDGVPSEVWFKLTDDGEPGTTDAMDVRVDDGGPGELVFEGTLTSGNHQAHGPIFEPAP